MLPSLLKSDSIFGIRVTSGMFGYSVIREIGCGAHSTIHLVRKPGDKTLFALKHIRIKSQREMRFFEQLQNEHRIGQLIRGPGLRKSLQLHAYRTVLHSPVEAGLLLEYVEGERLEKASCSMSQLVDCFAAVARSLHAMHDARIAHCDLKPGNIIIGTSGQVTLIDLGQACPFGTIKPRIQGTPDFISPEQVHCHPVSAATDVFGIGACLYWALTRRPLPTLFTLERGTNSFLLDATFPEPRELNPMVPAVLSKLVMDCVRTSPAKRPQSAMTVSRTLETIAFSLRRHYGDQHN